MKLSTLLAAPFVLAIAAPAFAQSAPAGTPPPAVYTQQPEPESKNSINVSPLGLLFGNLYVTYEKFMNGHGFIVDAGFGRNSGDGGNEAHGALGVGYRWHWRGRQNSGFLGVMVAQGFGTGEVTTNISGSEMTHGMTVRATTVTGNIGKRWMFGPVNATIRFGLGYGNYSAKAKENTPEAKAAEDTMNDLLSLLPIGFDGEVSIGYAF